MKDGVTLQGPSPESLISVRVIHISVSEEMDIYIDG
jgi:hypothetical protein